MLTNCRKIPVGILGATGIIGQHYLSLLADHPWFEPSFLAASVRSQDKCYAEAIQGQWQIDQPLPSNIASIPVFNVQNISEATKRCSFIFSAMKGPSTQALEEAYAQHELPVISNTSAHRKIKDVPLIIPEINANHLHIIPHQRKRLGCKKGFILAKPNCSIQSYLTAIYALKDLADVSQVMVSTMQAISGAGYPGISSLDILGNIIPHIEGEEEKSEQEPLKILGFLKDDAIIANDKLSFSAHCNRVPVLHGHVACINIKTSLPCTAPQIIQEWQNFNPLPQQLELPSAPKQAITYHTLPNRPQPIHDTHQDKGMTLSIGRLRPCSIFDWKFVTLSNNLYRGGAKGGILSAELLLKQQWLA